jgi:hypothetical protein
VTGDLRIVWHRCNVCLMIITSPKWRYLDFIVCRDTSSAATQTRRDCVFCFGRGRGSTGFHVAGGWANEDRFQLCGAEAYSAK